MTISSNLPNDLQGYKFSGVQGRMAAGRQVGGTDYASTFVEGPDAHDAAATGQPLQVGGVAESTTPMAVADGDAVRAFFDTLGQLAVMLRGSTGAALLPDGAALTDDTSNPTLTKIASYLMAYDGSTWDRARGDSANGLDVDVTRMPTVTSSTDVSLASAATSAQLRAANTARRGLLLTNTDANAAYLYYGTTATASKFTVLIPSGGYWEMPQPVYTGRIDAIWAADGSGSLIGSEL